MLTNATMIYWLSGSGAKTISRPRMGCLKTGKLGSLNLY